MLTIVWVKLKDVRQSIPMILIMTALALLLTYVFGKSFVGDDRPDVAIVDLDKSGISQSYIEKLVELGGFDYEMTSYDLGFEAVAGSRKTALIVIEKGFGEGLLDEKSNITMYKSGDTVEHYTLKANVERTTRLLVLEERFVTAASLSLSPDKKMEAEDELRQALAQKENYQIVSVSAVTISGSDTLGYNSLKHSFIGFLLFFSMFTMVFSIGSIVEEKENHVWQRQAVSPIGVGRILAGNMIAAFIVGMGQMILLVVVSRYLFDIDLGGSVMALLVILAGFVVAVTCMGLFLSGLVDTMQQLGAFSPIVVVSTSMIGGCMWPLEIITSKTLLFMADLTPQRWAYKGLESVIVNGGSFLDITKDFIILLVIALVFFVIGLLPYAVPKLKGTLMKS